MVPVAAVAPEFIVLFGRGWGAALSEVSCPDTCCSGIDGNCSVVEKICGNAGGGNDRGGFVREILLQLVENHLESTGRRRLLVCVPPLPEADVFPRSFISTRASQPL